MLPNFLLIGPGRSGTTWITKCLSAHPEIFIPRRKSTRYFSGNYANGLYWYESLFKDWSGERAIGEASAGYLPCAEAPARIKKLLPNVKLIATLRQPVDRSYSSYGRLLALAKPGELNFNISYEDKIKDTPRLLEEGLYAKHLDNYLHYFSQENMLILFYDDMKEDPAAFLRLIYEFLGVDSEFVAPVMGQKINATSTKRPRSKALYFAYRTLMRLKLFNLTQRIDQINSSEPPQIDPVTRDRLISDYYMADINSLERLTGRDLSSWKTLRTGKDVL